MKVLIVEDNELNRDMLSRRLKRLGFEVILAPDGVKAVEAAHTEGPDVILMDLNLPTMDGLAATARIRSDAATSHIPVIALTANARLEDRNRAFAAGCHDFVTKPIDVARLLDSVALAGRTERRP